MPTSPLTTRTSLAALQRLANLCHLPTKQRPNPRYKQPSFFAANAIMHKEFLSELCFFILCFVFYEYKNNDWVQDSKTQTRGFEQTISTALHLVGFQPGGCEAHDVQFHLKVSWSCILGCLAALLLSVHLLLLVNYYFYSEVLL